VVVVITVSGVMNRNMELEPATIGLRLHRQQEANSDMKLMGRRLGAV
jgi:hypothetical protein